MTEEQLAKKLGRSGLDLRPEKFISGKLKTPFMASELFRLDTKTGENLICSFGEEFYRRMLNGNGFRFAPTTPQRSHALQRRILIRRSLTVGELIGTLQRSKCQFLLPLDEIRSRIAVSRRANELVVGPVHANYFLSEDQFGLLGAIKVVLTLDGLEVDMLDVEGLCVAGGQVFVPHMLPSDRVSKEDQFVPAQVEIEESPPQSALLSRVETEESPPQTALSVPVIETSPMADAPLPTASLPVTKSKPKIPITIRGGDKIKTPASRTPRGRASPWAS
jgi:hypothetical protein